MERRGGGRNYDLLSKNFLSHSAEKFVGEHFRVPEKFCY